MSTEATISSINCLLQSWSSSPHRGDFALKSPVMTTSLAARLIEPSSLDKFFRFFSCRRCLRNNNCKFCHLFIHVRRYLNTHDIIFLNHFGFRFGY